MKKYTLLFLIFILPQFACLNGYEIRGDGEMIDANHAYEIKPYLVSKSQQKYYKILLKYDLKNLLQYDYPQLTDLSLSLIFLGYFEQAKNILTTLYQANPREYNIVVNLGTVNELLGNLDSANYFLKKSVEINPHSHFGTEWVHLKILEAEIAYSKDNNYFAKNTVFDFKVTALKKDLHAAQKIVRSIDYQLRTRVPFIPAPNPIMQQLFTELADFTYDTYSMRHAYTYYLFAQHYAGGKNQNLNIKIANTKKKANVDYAKQFMEIHDVPLEIDSITGKVIEERLDRVIQLKPLKEVLNFKKATWKNNRVYLHDLVEIPQELHNEILKINFVIPKKQEISKINKTEETNYEWIWWTSLVATIGVYIGFVLRKYKE
jgi:hypothetical protein